VTHPEESGPLSQTAASTAARAPHRIAELADGVEGIAATPLADHADAYQEIHAALQDALADIDGR
jgi:hypothetical protein